ncbi:molybdopterin-dependent oxidoreductase [Jiella sp. MQZ9-1]|uniref:Molybdopterin-dependent oxidoreductase n=1 Tax=Jiella flava TaxID=2816857 RepID=A0A939G390_9HYPH|nr:nitrate reductase [Jiella flava]MBO0664427.1 molybdopterin-dependent oxidoreductase [Jiella flava]MCD2473063.1 molybdopterin-dependent oxidoreductase [Jiella flava]
MQAAAATKTVRTTCAYCGVGCGVLATPAVDGSVAIAGDPDHPANFGRLCSKGSALGETLGLEERLLQPQIGGVPATWDRALDMVAARFSEAVADHGPDSVAFYLSGQLLTEDYYVANKLMKGFIGSANIDTNSRLCMASAVTGHKRAFGADTVPGSYVDLEMADLVVLTGSNLAWCHPVLFQRLAAAKAARPQMQVVVIDPRRTATCEIADAHLAIAADGDVALFVGLLNALVKEGAIDRDYIERHTLGFSDAARAAQTMSVRKVAAETGLGEAEIGDFFELFVRSERVVTIYSQGVNQSCSGSDKVNAIINCHLATGRIGRPGMGPFSVTGQPNAMGGREVGGLSNMLAAHMALEDAADRARVQAFWRAPRIADHAGLKAVELFDAVADGRIKALWIAGTNPVVSMARSGQVERALARCPFVVVSEVIAKTDTAAFGDVLLPAAAWGEKNGTVTNSERRISRQRPFLACPGEARPDWAIFADVARRMGFEGFDYQTAAEIFDEHARLSAVENHGSRDFEIGGLSGLTEAEYDALAPIQWPVRARRDRQETRDSRFFAEGGFFHSDGRARFVVTDPPVAATLAGKLVLNTGRLRDHWHTMTRTGLSARLSAHIAEPFAELNPRDAANFGIKEADLVRVMSPQGEAIVRALITERQRLGSVFVPMHWTRRFAPSGRIGAVTHAARDPLSGQPALKTTKVTIKRFEAAWHAFAIMRARPDIDRLAGEVAYIAAARTQDGWRVELAGEAALADPAAFGQTLTGDPDAETVIYRDRKTGTARVAMFRNGRLLGALYLSRSPVEVSRNWAVMQLTLSEHDAGNRSRLLAGRGGADRPDPGATICACFSVGANQIAALVASGEATTVEAVGNALRAGTNCGSCRSEIKTIIDDVRLGLSA